MHPIRTFREEKSLTQQDMGKLVGVSGQTVWRWESGSRRISKDVLPKVSEVTGIPKRELRPDIAELLES